MIMSFANPLGVGLTSDGEYFDIELKEPISSEDAVRQLNEAMVDGMEVVSFVQIPDEKKATGMAIIEAADYLAIPKKEGILFSNEDLASFISQAEILVLKQTKKVKRKSTFGRGSTKWRCAETIFLCRFQPEAQPI